LIHSNSRVRNAAVVRFVGTPAAFAPGDRVLGAAAAEGSCVADSSANRRSDGLSTSEGAPLRAEPSNHIPKTLGITRINRTDFGISGAVRVGRVRLP